MKKYIVPLLIFIALASIATMQNCGGTRILSTTLDVSRATIDSQLTPLVGASSGNFVTAEAVNTFFQILNEEGSSLFYSEAPGSMGTVASVMPLNWDSFNVATPTKAYAYFVFSNTGGVPRGALLVTTGNGTTQTPVIAMANDGQSLAPGVFSNVDFAMEMAVGSGSVDVRSYDVIDSDFAQTMQLEIYNPIDGGEEFLGLVTLTQPTN